MSLGLNYEGATSNRGKLWQGGFPGVDFRLHYWFDFNFALDLGMYSTPHYFDAGSTLLGYNDVRITWVGIDLKYYFDTKNLSSALTFINPYMMLGFGSYTKTQTPRSTDKGDKDTRFGVGPGIGMEFVLAPRKSYFTLESKLHFVDFKDASYSGLSSQGIPDLRGLLYTFTGSLLFTW